jgi:hypothetical protein
LAAPDPVFARDIIPVQLWPGDGMRVPGDCSWARYLLLSLHVESAKAVANMLRACAAGDSCLFLALKIAAIAAEIAARVTLDTNCFKGGSDGHRKQVQQRVTNLNDCYDYFQSSKCPANLIEAMEVVVAGARAFIEANVLAAAIEVVVAAVAALVAAIVAVAQLIAAAAAAAAEAAALTEAAAALLVLLRQIGASLSTATP